MTETIQIDPKNLSAALLPKPQSPVISADFPYESKFVNVLGERMHYVEQGEGDPILFLHGNPTSSYLWRNVMPYLEKQGRVIAVDNIGFGKSSKPDIHYTFADHARYIEAFIDTLALQNITFVTHEWGAALGFDYAARYEENVRGIAFMEATLPPLPLFPKSDAMEHIAPILECLRDPILGFKSIIEENQFIEALLPAGVMRSLTEVEMEVYRLPFVEQSSRKPILAWPNQFPIDRKPSQVMIVMENYGKWLVQTDLPKLHIYSSPGIVNSPLVVETLMKILKNYETAYVGMGLHYLQEDEPEAVGRSIADWCRRLAGIKQGSNAIL
ncbi:haloalkane dehalogenase [Nostoc sp. NIES-4103]|nr:haloalkane dehalogenase [Nostoc sp. NIES-4103]